MYDRNHDMKIDRNELLEVLKMMVGGNIHDDQIGTIADHTIGELVETTIDLSCLSMFCRSCV
jgi:calcineurin B homologous protein 1